MRCWTVLDNKGLPDGTIVETGFNTYFRYNKNGIVTASAVKMGNMIVQYNAFGLPERTLVETYNTDNGDITMPSPISFF